MDENKIYTPEFIPFYIVEIKKYKLSTLEGLIYGFIRFYNKYDNNGFYFKTKSLAKILLCSPGSIDNGLKKLEEKGLIIRKTKSVISGGKHRIIYLGNGELIKGGDRNSSNDEMEYISNKKEYIKKNNIKDKFFINIINEGKIFKDKNGINILEDENLLNTFQDFIDMRKEIKSKLTKRAIELILNKAKNYSLDYFIAMLEQSIENSWKGIFEVKGYSTEDKKYKSIIEKADKEAEARKKRYEEYIRKQNFNS